MESHDIGRLIYLGLLGLVIAGWFVSQSRLSLNKTLQQAAAWVLIFLGVIAIVGLWEDIRDTVQPRQVVFSDENRIVVPRMGDGHYYLRAEVNGAPVDFVVDTGASGMVLTREDADRVGLDPDGLNYIGRAMTANGEVRTAPVRIDRVTLGPVTDTDLPAVVNGGEMSQSLLGMEYLQRWGRIEISNGELSLTR
ncbi:TIGR02281 family clan AA aspartic protease [Sulfitobacter sp. D35]|uniref:retropepsin-like aspartic protease family protein n=1 Tax=Sulfitobacter sp. D35 TaxID=3083252 RepID=UPI00296E5832|nr:TIGR02281 family clan AA aspartic protease [Sulfitobacter sp. D35]MDW4497629.1 TIGR02281 family clan AA aspartic protease [Sulfitobacter sp. D35]